MASKEERLIEACERDNASAVAKLLAGGFLSKGADVNCEREGRTPLTAAINGGHMEIIALLLDNGADVNLPGMYGQTPLVHSLKQGRPDIANRLIQRGARDDMAVAYAIANFRCQDIANALIAQGALDVKDKRGNTLLMMSLQNKEIFGVLITKGLDINARNEDGETALLMAAEKCYIKPEVLELLVRHGADANVSNANGHSALMFAAGDQSMEKVGLLLAAGADVNAENNLGQTPLSLVCQAFGGQINLDLVQLLLDKGARVDARDRWGNTPLMQAACCYHGAAAIELLVTRGAEVGATALDLARTRSYAENVEILERLARRNRT